MMVTYFDVLGLPRTFALDPKEVERNYLQRSRELHPDYHQLASASERKASLDLTAGLNEAYATLSDPFRRAEYILKLEGGPSASEHKQMPPDFLEEQLELRMQIEELRENDDPAALSAIEQQLEQRRGRLVGDLAARFAEYEADAKKPLLVEVRQLLNIMKYVQGQLRDLRAD
jgi:molecular chaperone HscB